MVIFQALLNIDDSNIPLPHVQGVTDVEELFLPVKLEFMQGFGPCLPSKAVELLTVDADEVAQIAIPSENGAHDFMKFGELHVVGYLDEADDHGAHLT